MGKIIRKPRVTNFGGITKIVTIFIKITLKDSNNSKKVEIMN